MSIEYVAVVEAESTSQIILKNSADLTVDCRYKTQGAICFRRPEYLGNGQSMTNVGAIFIAGISKIITELKKNNNNYGIL